MEMAGESAIGVSVLRDWASDVRLGVLPVGELDE